MLFDLESDPGERENLAESRQRDFKTLSASLARYTESLLKVPAIHQTTGTTFSDGSEAVAIPEKDLEQLRALGYAN